MFLADLMPHADFGTDRRAKSALSPQVKTPGLELKEGAFGESPTTIWHPRMSASLIRAFAGLLLAFLVLPGTMPSARAALLVATNAHWRMFKGRSEPTADLTQWRQRAYDDSTWSAATAPFSYGDGITQGTVLVDMQGNYSTLYLRTRFQIGDATEYSRILLRAACDDGFIAWLNGREVVRYNAAAGNRPFDDHTAPDRATASVSEPVLRTDYPLNLANLLVNGENVLCIQVLNATLFSSDLFFDAELTAAANETVAPLVLNRLPAPGEATNLSQVTVIFSEPVTGVDVGDLVLNGFPATAMTSANATTYTFRFGPLPFGPVRASWITGHGIADTAGTPNGLLETEAANSWNYLLIDPSAPLLQQRLPAAGTVRQLSSVEITFSEPVTGVDAADLLIQGVPADAVSGIGAGPYLFTFPASAPGLVEIRFAVGHGIADVGFAPLGFAGGTWNVTVNPALVDPTLRINELVAANATGLRDEDGEEEPWIELHNFGTTAVNLANLALTDDTDDPGAWILPNLSLGADQYLVVFASGKDRNVPVAGQRVHTNFRLSRRGEYVGLYNAESPRRPISELPAEYPAQRNDLSWGRQDDGTWAYFRTPTPGLRNRGAIVTNACEPVHFSVERGYFSGAFELILTTPTPGTQIRYTLTGAEPNATNSLPYTAPILVNRTLVIRANVTRDDLLPSETRTHSYLVGISTAQRGLPALSLATATNNLTGPTGIVGMQGGTRDAGGAWVRRLATDYYNPLNRGSAWERPVSVEFLNPAANGEFQVDAGLRLHASDYFRPRLTPSSKFSWRLYFRGDYGEGRLRFPLVPVSSVEEFDALVCRAGSNDLNPFVHDEIQRRLFADCGQVSARGTFAVLFLNGRYSGYYNPVERIESDFLAIQHGGTEAWDVISQSGALDGDRNSFNELISAVQTGSPTDHAWYQAMTRRLDVTNFVDYLLVNAYGFNGDWPGNNWRAARERRVGALWRYYIWDAEWSFGFGGRSVSGNTFSELGTTGVGILYSRLRQHPEFRLLFADRVHRHLYNGGALTETNVVRNFAQTTAGLSALISGINRSITNTWVRSRPAPLRSHLIAQGLFASSNSPVLRPHGGLVASGHVLNLTHLTGDVWYTTDGTDPRVAFTGAVSSRALRYDPAVPPVLTTSLTLRARALQGIVWSALTEASFTVGEPGVPVRISELMYQPPGGSAYEFIELRNLSGRSIDLSGYTFEGVELRFPANTLFPARAVWILASNNDPAAFAIRYPGIPVAATFAGSLNNGGESITLRDATGALVDRVRYRPDQGWPNGAAGNGRSLERVRFNGDSSDPDAWQDSAVNGGSPGGAVPPRPIAAVVRIDEVFAANTGQVVRGTNTPDFVEVLALAPGSIDLSGWILSRTDRTNRFVLPSGTRLEQGDRLVLWCGEAAAGDLTTGFRLDSNAGTIVLTDAAGARQAVFAYGPQAAGWSVGFIGDPAALALLIPTPGEVNIAAETAGADSLVLNEWLANPFSGEDDFIELFNRHEQLPAYLPGLYLSVSNSTVPLRLPSAVGPRGFASFKANEGGEPDELPVRLPAAGSVLRLLSAAGSILDEARYNNALEGVAQGRFPDGSTNVVFLPLGGTPGEPNLLTPRAGPRLSEVFAASIPGSPQPDLARDWIELVNAATNAVPMGGWQIVQTLPGRRTWAVPAGIQLGANARLRIFADSNTPPSTVAAAQQNTGFDLPDTGGILELVAAEGVVRDRLIFGPQLAGRSIGLDSSTNWVLLATVTPGRTNAPNAPLAFGEFLRINEWLAQSTNAPDFIELHNAADQPVDLSGWLLTDDPSLAGMSRFRIPPLTFIDAFGWRAFTADGSPHRGPDHTPFQLSARGESLRLYRPSSNLVDSTTVLPVDAGIAAGRFPDGSALLTFLSTPTPGAANVFVADADADGLPDLWETANGLDPNLASDAALDGDLDGRSNLDEFLAGTDPRDANSVLALSASIVDGVIHITFTAEAGRSYGLQARDTLSEAWTQLQTFEAAGSRRKLEFQLLPGGPTPQRLYRVATP